MPQYIFIQSSSNSKAFLQLAILKQVLFQNNSFFIIFLYCLAHACTFFRLNMYDVQKCALILYGYPNLECTFQSWNKVCPFKAIRTVCLHKPQEWPSFLYSLNLVHNGRGKIWAIQAKNQGELYNIAQI